MDKLNGEQLRQMTDHDLLIRVAERIEAVCVDVIDTRAELRAQNGRVRSLENWRYLLAGGLTVLLFILGVFAQYVLPRLP